jgi:hypothetical protein
LRTAVTALAEQGIAGQALGVHATEHRSAVRHVTEAQNNVFTPGGFFKKTIHGERGKRGWQLGSGNENDGHRVLLISDFTGDRL